MKTLIETIKQFETNEAKYYWISKLNVADSVKGYLIIYFNLLNG